MTARFLWLGYGILLAWTAEVVMAKERMVMVRAAITTTVWVVTSMMVIVKVKLATIYSEESDADAADGDAK